MFFMSSIELLNLKIRLIRMRLSRLFWSSLSCSNCSISHGQAQCTQCCFPVNGLFIFVNGLSFPQVLQGTGSGLFEESYFSIFERRELIAWPIGCIFFTSVSVFYLFNFFNRCTSHYSDCIFFAFSFMVFYVFL